MQTECINKNILSFKSTTHLLKQVYTTLRRDKWLSVMLLRLIVMRWKRTVWLVRGGLRDRDTFQSFLMLLHNHIWRIRKMPSEIDRIWRRTTERTSLYSTHLHFHSTYLIKQIIISFHSDHDLVSASFSIKSDLICLTTLQPSVQSPGRFILTGLIEKSYHHRFLTIRIRI